MDRKVSQAASILVLEVPVPPTSTPHGKDHQVPRGHLLGLLAPLDLSMTVTRFLPHPQAREAEKHSLIFLPNPQLTKQHNRSLLAIIIGALFVRILG